MLQAEQKRADALRRGVTSSTCERRHPAHCATHTALLSAWPRRTLFPDPTLPCMTQVLWGVRSGGAGDKLTRLADAVLLCAHSTAVSLAVRRPIPPA